MALNSESTIAKAILFRDNADTLRGFNELIKIAEDEIQACQLLEGGIPLTHIVFDSGSSALIPRTF